MNNLVFLNDKDFYNEINYCSINNSFSTLDVTLDKTILSKEQIFNNEVEFREGEMRCLLKTQAKEIIKQFVEQLLSEKKLKNIFLQVTKKTSCYFFIQAFTIKESNNKNFPFIVSTLKGTRYPMMTEMEIRNKFRLMPLSEDKKDFILNYIYQNVDILNELYDEITVADSLMGTNDINELFEILLADMLERAL